MSHRKPSWFERLFGPRSPHEPADSSDAPGDHTAEIGDGGTGAAKEDTPASAAQMEPTTEESKEPAPYGLTRHSPAKLSDADFYRAMRVRIAPLRPGANADHQGAYEFLKDAPVRPFAEDMTTRLCLDLDGGVFALEDADLFDRGPVEHLYRMGYRNLWQDLIDSDLAFKEVRSDSGVLPRQGDVEPEMLWSIEGSSYYAGSAPLFLEELFERFKPGVDLSSGIIFASPHRHLTLAREVTNGNDLMGSIGLMATMAAEEFSSSTGQISPRLHLLHMGEVTTFTDVVWGNKDRQVEIQVKPTPYLMSRISDGLDGDGGLGGFGPGPGGPGLGGPGGPALP